MSEIHFEGIRSLPCFDANLLSTGSPVHIMEYQLDAEEFKVIETFGLIRSVRPDELVIIYMDSDKKVVNPIKEKKVTIDSVLSKQCSIELLKPVNKDERTKLLDESHKLQKKSMKMSLLSLSL